MTPIAPILPWGQTTSDPTIWESFGLYGNVDLYPTNFLIELAKVVRILCHESGPTAATNAVIRMMIKNHEDNRALGPNVKMVRDTDITEILNLIRSGNRAVSAKLPTNLFFKDNYIFKNGPKEGNHIYVLDRDRVRNITITPDLPEWIMATVHINSIKFMYKRDPEVTDLATLNIRCRGLQLDISSGAYVEFQGSRLARLLSVMPDEFNGTISAETSEGHTHLAHPAFLYHPKFHLLTTVKVVRDAKLRNKLNHVVAHRGHLNMALMVDRVYLRAGKIHYEVYRFVKEPGLDGAPRLSRLGRIRDIPEDLLIKTGRTKAFGSI